jgi:ribosomal protein L40E
MRGGVVAGGVILMIVGLIMIFTLGGVRWGASSESIGGGGITFFPLVGAGMAIIGFLVFIAGLAASPTPKEQAPVVISVPGAEKTSEVLVVCPECGEHVSAKSKFCPECGAELRPKPRAKARETEVPKKAGFCMYCGAELPEDSKFCPECGKKVK